MNLKGKQALYLVITNIVAMPLTLVQDFPGECKREIRYFKNAKDSDVRAEKPGIGYAKGIHENELTIFMMPAGGYAAYIVRK